jgi:hypothetical protein
MEFVESAEGDGVFVRSVKTLPRLQNVVARDRLPDVAVRGYLLAAGSRASEGQKVRPLATQRRWRTPF